MHSIGAFYGPWGAPAASLIQSRLSYAMARFMTDSYAVFGNPIAHSKSPIIHAAFARQTGQDMRYAALLVPLEGFREAVMSFRAEGARGANVTVPFKEQAFAVATRCSERAEMAGAVNTLKFEAGDIFGDNTDGAGLVRDLVGNLGVDLAGKRILLMGAGGAARGVIPPLLEQAPACLFIANRTADKADALACGFAGQGRIAGGGYGNLTGEFDVVINATAASLAGDLPPLPDDVFASGALAYDMMYGQDTPFLAFARARRARAADGLGMLVEQAAEAFFVWRGVRPDTAPVIEMLRAGRCSV
jgi:shikimate dehydrogenase